jgi:adenosylcobinamide-GDP ribazoletransferase
MAVVYAGLHEVVGRFVAAALVLAFQLIVTGAFHEDGLGDVADAYGAGGDRDEVIRILKDPTHGTFGVAAISLSMLIRTGAIATLDAWGGVAALPAAHALSRAASVGLMGAFPPATERGLGASYARRVGRGQVLVAIAAGLCVGVGLLAAWGLAAAAIGGLAAWTIARGTIRRLGGITGDVLGAAQQACEITVLVVAAAIAVGGESPAWWR